MKPFAQRLREAADTVEEATKRHRSTKRLAASGHYDEMAWSPWSLRDMAKNYDRINNTQPVEKPDLVALASAANEAAITVRDSLIGDPAKAERLLLEAVDALTGAIVEAANQ